MAEHLATVEAFHIALADSDKLQLDRLLAPNFSLVEDSVGTCAQGLAGLLAWFRRCSGEGPRPKVETEYLTAAEDWVSAIRVWRKAVDESGMPDSSQSDTKPERIGVAEPKRTYEYYEFSGDRIRLMRSSEPSSSRP